MSRHPLSSRLCSGKVVVGLLVLQIVIFLLSLGPALMTISVFCTASRSSSLERFGWIHLALAALFFFFGLASLPWARLRWPYVILLLLGLSTLPVQASLVQRGSLYCEVL